MAAVKVNSPNGALVTPPAPCYICPVAGWGKGRQMTRKATEIVQLKLQFAEALRRKLEKEAARNGRSMNSEIIHRLEQSFTAPDITQVIAERLQQAVARVGGGPAEGRDAAGRPNNGPRNRVGRNPGGWSANNRGPTMPQSARR